MNKWASKTEVFAAVFSVATIWSCIVTLIIMKTFPGVFESSFVAPLVATYGPGFVAGLMVIKKLWISIF